jgi:hypothetical protein
MPLRRTLRTASQSLDHCPRAIGDDGVESRQGGPRMIAESDHSSAQEGGGRDGDAIEVEMRIL